ncbi:MAG TPA: MFS transporter [Thermomicrobiaceae bacterium]|nr:MFS transporter [Thermomicrobiaceae bacterium]
MARAETVESVERIQLLPLAALCLVVLLIYGSTYLLLAVLPIHIRALVGSESTVGTIMSLFSLAALLVRPFAGLLADRVGRRPSIFAGALLIGVSCIGYALAGAHTIFLARILNGLGWGAVTAATATVAADLAPPSRRGFVLGIYGTVTGLALAVGPAAGTWLAGRLSLTTTFWIAAACGFAAAAGILLLHAPSPPRAPSSRFGLHHLFTRQALGPAAIMLCFTLMYGTVLTFVPLYAIDRHLGSSGAFFSVFALVLIVMRVTGGRLSDRWGRFAVIAPGFIFAGVAMVVLAGAQQRALLLLAAVLFAVAFALVQPAAQAWAVDRSPAELRGTTLSTVVAAQDLGISLGTVAAGFIADAFGYGGLFLVLTVVALAGLATAWLVFRAAGLPLRATHADAA